MARSLLVAPAAEDVGLARTCFGLLRALDRIGIQVDYVKPVAQPRADGTPDRSAALVAAVRDGVSVDTSMGLTPLEGLVMGTRSGDVGRVLARLGFLGLTEDAEANAQHGRHTRGRISPDGPVLAMVVPTNEELLIARDTARLIAGG